MKAHTTDSMFLFHIDEFEITKIVRECKPNKSAGCDGINMNIILKCQQIHFRIFSVSYMCNLS